MPSAPYSLKMVRKFASTSEESDLSALWAARCEGFFQQGAEGGPHDCPLLGGGE